MVVSFIGCLVVVFWLVYWLVLVVLYGDVVGIKDCYFIVLCGIGCFIIGWGIVLVGLGWDWWWCRLLFVLVLVSLVCWYCVVVWWWCFWLVYWLVCSWIGDWGCSLVCVLDFVWRFGFGWSWWYEGEWCDVLYVLVLWLWLVFGWWWLGCVVVWLNWVYWWCCCICWCNGCCLLGLLGRLVVGLLMCFVYMVCE